jgi:hypothetical protein
MGISVKKALKFRHWYWSLVPKLEFRSRNRNSDSELEIRVRILMSTSNPKLKFRFWHRNFKEKEMKCCWNFDFDESKQSKSKPKSKLQFRHQNQKFGKSKHRNFDEIRINFVGILISLKVKKWLPWKPFFHFAIRASGLSVWI